MSGSSVTAVELTQNEWNAAINPQWSGNYRIYLVTKTFSPQPRIEIVVDPSFYVESGQLSIRPVRYVLDLRQSN